MKDYNKLLHAKADRSFNTIVLVTSVVAFVASIFLFVADLPPVFGILNISVSVVLMLIYLLAHKVDTSWKILAVIIMTSTVAIASYIGGEFTSAFLSILTLSNILAVLFLDRKQSIIVSVASILLLFAFAYYSTSIKVDPMVGEPVLTWGLQIVAYIMVLTVLHISVGATKRFLFESIESLEASIKVSNQLAYYDQLTGLPNAHKFIMDVEQLIASNHNDGFILFFNLSSLNLINSTFSQEFGDQTLIELADLFLRVKLKNSVVARTGGNEFAIWIEGISEEALVKRFSYLIGELKSGTILGKKKLEFHASYSNYRYGEDSLEACYQRATLTLTYAKDHSLHALVPYKDELERTLRRNESIKDLIEKAIYKEEIDLYYQAQYNSRTGQVVGVEALARWQSEELGWVSPYEFIPIIESLNLSIELGEYVIERACKDYGDLKEQYDDSVSISVNISPSHMMDHSIIGKTKELLEGYEVPPNKLKLEITEDIIIEGIELVKPILKDLRALGVEISLDDFGSGYSSLNYLTQLELDELKIDKSFVDLLEADEQTHILIENVMHLAKRLGLKVIAEGVETQEQKDIINHLGCYMIQGYYYAKPEALRRG